MKSRLSLTVDPQVTHRAKRYAQSKNKSLSALVEEFLEGVGNTASGESTSRPETFSLRWKQRLKPAQKDELRYQRLAEKYDL